MIKSYFKNYNKATKNAKTRQIIKITQCFLFNIFSRKHCSCKSYFYNNKCTDILELSKISSQTGSGPEKIDQKLLFLADARSLLPQFKFPKVPICSLVLATQKSEKTGRCLEKLQVQISISHQNLQSFCLQALQPLTLK